MRRFTGLDPKEVVVMPKSLAESDRARSPHGWKSECKARVAEAACKTELKKQVLPRLRRPTCCETSQASWDEVLAGGMASQYVDASTVATYLRLKL